MIRFSSLKSLINRAFLGVLLGAALTAPHQVLADTLSFALFGDVYMTPAHQGYLKGMLDDMADKNAKLAVFTGGLKPAEQACQDNNLLAAYPIFAKAPLPTFYIPGDAEWVLCAKFSPEERLNLLRKTFYQSDRSLGTPSLPLVRQSDYPELMRWQIGPAVFVTLNVTQNDTKKPLKAETADTYLELNAASLAWLQEGLRVARENSTHMLVIVVHEDPGLDIQTEDQIPKAYQPFVNLLKSEVPSFPGQILLVHGGNGVHRIDHPLLNDHDLPYQNFTRVETYGALQQGWVQVRIERNEKNDNNPVTRTEFNFESFPWPPLKSLSDDAADDSR